MVSSSPTQNKLKGLKIELVEEALKKSQTEEDGEINRWLLDIFGK